MVRCIDISNWTTPALTLEHIAAWRAEGVGLAIVQCVDPPSPYPPTQTRAQLQVCQDGGMPADGYNYCWWAEPVSEFAARFNLFDGYRIGRLWVDAEDVETGLEWTPQQRTDALLRACDAADTWAASHGCALPSGVYSAEWVFNRYLGQREDFAGRPLWAVGWDGYPDPTVFTPFAGWTECAIKQYWPSAELAGVTGIDMNVLSLSEQARVAAQHPPENPWAGLIGAIAYLGDTVGDNLLAECNRRSVTTGRLLSVRRSVVRAQAAEMQRVHEEFVGPRP